MKKFLTIMIIIAMYCTPCIALAEANFELQPVVQEIPFSQNNTQYPVPVNSYQPQNYNFDKLQGKVVMVPARTVVEAVTTSPISSETARIGDKVVFYLTSDFYYGRDLIAPAGSRINGSVVISKKGGLGYRSGQLQVKFSNIVTPTGQMIPMLASIKTNDGTGILKAGTGKDVAKEYVKDAAIGAAAGAVLGTAMGALSSGKVGKGAIYGTAMGGGLGLAQNAFERGGNVEIPQGTQLELILDQPITFTSTNSPY